MWKKVISYYQCLSASEYSPSQALISLSRRERYHFKHRSLPWRSVLGGWNCSLVLFSTAIMLKNIAWQITLLLENRNNSLKYNCGHLWMKKKSIMSYEETILILKLLYSSTRVSKRRHYLYLFSQQNDLHLFLTMPM